MARRKGNAIVWVLVSVLGGGFVLAIGGVAAVVVLLASYQPHGTRVELNHGSELYYTKDVSKDEADKLAAFLNAKYVPADHKVSVQLAKPNGLRQVRFVIDEAKVGESELAFLAMGYLMSIEVFDTQPLEVHLCDPSLKTLKTIDIKGKSGAETAKK
jgi:hypothetical protein